MVEDTKFFYWTIAWWIKQEEIGTELKSKLKSNLSVALILKTFHSSKVFTIFNIIWLSYKDHTVPRDIKVPITAGQWTANCRVNNYLVIINH